MPVITICHRTVTKERVFRWMFVQPSGCSVVYRQTCCSGVQFPILHARSHSSLLLSVWNIYRPFGKWGKRPTSSGPLPHGCLYHSLQVLYTSKITELSGCFQFNRFVDVLVLLQYITAEQVALLCQTTAATNCEAIKVNLISILGFVGKMAAKKEDTLDILKVPNPYELLLFMP